MTVEEFYAEIGGNYSDIISRLRTQERITKFAGMFAKDESYNTLVRALDEGDAEEAFRAAHTIKGMCQNMAFDRLYESAHTITETLRSKDIETARTQLQTVTEDYNLVIDGIHKLLE
jgi:HPt (histidine-containing phosphotransfer) domain-containing protein